MSRSEKELILVVGGVRSGKSSFAQRLAEQKGKRVLFIATADAGDAEMAERVQQHRAARPAEWDTVEEPRDLARALRGTGGHDLVLIDCLGVWVTNLMPQDEDVGTEAWEKQVLQSTADLLQAYDDGHSWLIVVSNEVGMGIVPAFASGRHFRDVVGRVNQLVASRADRVYLVACGIPLELKSLSERGRLAPS